jgi:hypothetical protein
MSRSLLKPRLNVKEPIETPVEFQGWLLKPLGGGRRAARRARRHELHAAAAAGGVRRRGAGARGVRHAPLAGERGGGALAKPNPLGVNDDDACERGPQRGRGANPADPKSGARESCTTHCDAREYCGERSSLHTTYWTNCVVVVVLRHLELTPRRQPPPR